MGARRSPHQYNRGLLLDLKRGRTGTYQHCAKNHLHRYAAEFEFRYNNRSAHGVNDSERAKLAPEGNRGQAADVTKGYA